MNLTPLPLKGRGWGLGLYSMQLGSAISLFCHFPGGRSLEAS
ncbi:hypothetical protein COO91_06395 [Nostoc flagelliforme CCNUN1]|uniref:Uncharacterized protein n=1 Tax=Nostoc flagelliforme CCNUN1 TaxID=2038116 RepID=A0A2K8SY75_9NOSO|nr:hypothetical protein COO91_06395 [Nostoc flagelliforme CCNUN1]